MKAVVTGTAARIHKEGPHGTSSPNHRGCGVAAHRNVRDRRGALDRGVRGPSPDGHKVRGRFTEFTGAIEVGEGAEESSVHVEIVAASMQTNPEMRDDHLTSGDFLESETHPAITFAQHGGAADGRQLVRGRRRPHDQGRHEAGDARVRVRGCGRDRTGQPDLGVSAKTTIEREEWKSPGTWRSRPAASSSARASTSKNRRSRLARPVERVTYARTRGPLAPGSYHSSSNSRS